MKSDISGLRKIRLSKAAEKISDTKGELLYQIKPQSKRDYYK